MESDAVIRDARSEDAEEIARLLGELGYPADAQRVQGRLDRLERNPDTRVYVAVAEGRIAGLVGLHVLPLIEHDELGCQLTAIVVGEHYRRRGIGRDLVRAVESEARSMGCGVVVLNTSERRAGAHAFYEQLGFRATGRRYVKEL